MRELMNRLRLSILVRREKVCSGTCLWCRYYYRCIADGYLEDYPWKEGKSIMRRLWRFTIHIFGERVYWRYVFGDSGFFTLREEIFHELENQGAVVYVDYYRKGKWRPFDTYHFYKEGETDGEADNDVCLP